jgi:eukaryotic-like serine/threonine-protein kinase
MSDDSHQSISVVGEATNLRGQLDEVRLIAKGGMAEIYRARQPSLGRHVVIKKLKDELMRNPETVERFRREARALASVLHQNIAHVYDFVETPRESYILMEYIDGIDLSTILQKVGHLPADLTALILLGVAKGVGYIHAHHLIHRDIKPGNIRITSRGEIKLMDFGIVVDTENEGLTRPGMMVGSPNYLSPEQVLGDPISHRADIFLLGICLYEMLSGVKPFRDEAGQTVFQRIRETKFIPLRQMRGHIPHALDKIVKRCLQADPKKRFDSVKELIDALELYLGSHKKSLAEDIVLKFLDEEALLTPTVPYKTDNIPEQETAPIRLSWRLLVPALAIAILIFAGGWYMGKQAGMVDAVPLQPTAKPMQKSLY